MGIERRRKLLYTGAGASWALAAGALLNSLRSETDGARDLLLSALTLALMLTTATVIVFVVKPLPVVYKLAYEAASAGCMCQASLPACQVAVPDEPAWADAPDLGRDALVIQFPSRN